MIPTPYLLYLGDAQHELSVKTSRGVADWRPEAALAEFRGPRCGVSLDLPHMDFNEAAAAGARTVLFGVANAGGVLEPALVEDALAALEAGLNIASGLHQRLTDQPQIAARAAHLGLQIFDVRQPPAGLAVGTGRPRRGRRLLTVGTDCSVGKMYTTLAIKREMRRRGLSSAFRATGQTGIFIAGAGVPIDAVVADFISGAVEALSPERDEEGWDLIEGQGSLFHPSFAGVSLGLLHGAQPDALVLCHEPQRPHMRGLPDRGLPDLSDCLEANLQAARLTNPGVRAVGVALNTSKLPRDAAQRLCEETSARLNLPCQDPVAMGVAQIVDRLIACFEP